MSKKTTRNALFTSLMSLLLCASMLVGTTFAWFTDSVTSTGNIIKSGVLDVEMTWAEEFNGTWKDASTGAIFDYQLWEPGFTQTRYVKIANVGNLDFKYKLTIVPNFTPAAGEANLADVIDVYLVPAAAYDRASADAIMDTAQGTLLSDLIKDEDGAAYGTMNHGDSETYCIILHMQETAGNEYQNLSVGDGFSVHLLATQLASEADSFGPDYDVESEYTALPAAGATQVVAGQTGSYTVNIKAADDLTGSTKQKVATAIVPAAAVAAGADEVTFLVEEGTTASNITIQEGQTAETYEITATGLDENNTAPVTFELFVGKNKNVMGVLHYDQPVVDDEGKKAWTYSSVSGYVTFVTKGFSPFTVIFSNEAAEVIPTPPPTGDSEVLPEGMPTPIVTPAADCVGVKLPWSAFGPFGVYENENQTLEAAYVFKAPHDSETVAECAFKDWHCDYFVKVDRDLGEKQIFLGGNYGSFGWVGFDNADITLNAGEEIPLLGSAADIAWTYEGIVNLVGEFTCGVAQVQGSTALSGATFTVMLRLTNPENADEFYNVATFNHTFA